jgi:hypothetical protein
VASEARAAAPRNEWRTVVTPSFRVHFHEGEELLAPRVAEIGERALVDLAAVLGSWPDTPIHVVLTDENDGANGFAQTLPYGEVVLFAAVPEATGGLGDFDEYIRMLFIHELSHVVHLDTVRGVPRIVNQIFGKVVAPNQVQPRWIVEGLATWLESHFTSGGRVRSRMFDAILRARIVARRFPDLDEISTFTREWPGGSAPYLYGGRFLSFIAEKYGTEALAEMSNRYGGRVLPYGINVVARETIGKDFLELWAEWRELEEARARAIVDRVDQEGIARGERVIDLGESVRAVRFSRRGRLVAIEGRRDGDTAVLVADGIEARSSTGALALRGRTLRLRTSNGESAFTQDGEHLVSVIADVHDRRFFYRDLDLIDLATGARSRRTEGARLSEPDVSVQDRIVAVAQGSSRTWLVTLSVFGDDTPEVLVPPEAGAQLSGPRWSPDGRSIAFATARTDGTRSIELFDLDRKTRRAITRSTALDQGPAWSIDGGQIYFASDRGGVFNIHRVDLASERVERVTNVVTGAFEPSIDPGGRLVFSEASADGFDLRAIDLAVLSPKEPDPPPTRPVPTSSASATVYPIERYEAWESLLPHAFFVELAIASSGAAVSVRVDGEDAVGIHAYRLRLTFDPDTSRLGYGAFYSNRSQVTPISLSSSLYTSDQPSGFVALPRFFGQRISVWSLRLGLDVPLGWWDVGQAISFSYGVELRRAIDSPPLDPFQLKPRIRGDLTLASLTATWSISTARGFEDSIGNETGFGFDVSAQLNHPILGSDLRVLEVSSHLVAFVSPPWAKHHVFAARGSFGASVGDSGERSVYGLGGLPIRDIFSDVARGIRFGADVLRGYEQNTVQGPSFYLGTIEYRLPLFRVERGIDTLPFFADRLHAAIFIDAGDTPAGPPKLESLRAGAGLELRADFVIGYFLPIDIRAGYARGLMQNGIDDFYLVLGGTY